MESDMLPSSLGTDLFYCSQADVVVEGQRRVSQRAVANQLHVALRQFCKVLRFPSATDKPMSISMCNVFGFCYVLKVVYPVILRVVINVVDLFAHRFRPQKCFGHHPVNVTRMLDPVSAKRHSASFVFPNLLLQQKVCAGGLARSGAFNAPKRRYCIPALKADDVTPLFICFFHAHIATT